MRYLFILNLLIVFSGCDLPVANQVKEGSKTEFYDDLNQKNEIVFDFKQNKLEFFINWSKGPFNTSTQASVMLITVLDDRGEAFSFPENFEIVFDALMPEMGHGLDKSGFFQEISPGLYKNEEIRFQMPGQWMMRILLIDYDNFDSDPVEVYRWESFI